MPPVPLACEALRVNFCSFSPASRNFPRARSTQDVCVDPNLHRRFGGEKTRPDWPTLHASCVDGRSVPTYIAFVSIPGLDFGLFIAYVLPGVLALYGLSLLSARLREFLRPNVTEPSIGAVLIVTVLALAAGRVISVGRAGLMDPTFGVALPLVSCDGAADRGAITPVEPDYRQLADAGRREAYLLAVAGEQRQYQFCGNTVLAALLVMVCALIALRRKEHHRSRTLGVGVACLVLGILLYFGARASYYSFMRAVAVLNGTQFNTLDRSGRPCRVTAPAAPRGAG